MMPDQIAEVALPRGREQIVRTLKAMIVLISRGSGSMLVRHVALQVVKDCPPKDFSCMAGTIFEWVRHHLVYRHDAYAIEQITHPETMLRAIGKEGQTWGDCDDFTVLIAAMLKSLGFQVKARAIRYVGQVNYSHVVPVVFRRDLGRWVEMDGTTEAPVDYPRTSVLETISIV